jgi:NAD(P)-dependent dehydrogenase (short-subunit alcohol dehydrogenase family)
MADRLTGKCALVTGGGSGIGRAIATVFAREGARVAICGQTVEKLQHVCEEIAAFGGDCLPLVCDVSQTHAVQDMMRRVADHFGALHVLVNNAGVRASISTIEDLSEEEWTRTFDIDAKGAWLCSKFAIPHLRAAGGGSIVMISSISAHIGQPKQGCYSAAKAAQELLMKCMAIDFAADRIRVNSICPAWIRTEMNREQLREMEGVPDRVYPPGVTFNDLLQMHPIGRLGEPEDVAWAAVYLASDEARWVTGASLMVDGGYTAR